MLSVNAKSSVIGNENTSPTPISQALAAQRDKQDPDYKKARLAADSAALATQRNALKELERARKESALSADQQRRELDSRIEALRGRVTKREQRVTEDEMTTKSRPAQDGSMR